MDISPSLIHFFRLPTPGFLLHCSTSSLLEDHSIQLSSIFAPGASAADHKACGRRAHPCSPSDNYLIVLSFAFMQKPGHAILLLKTCKLPDATMGLNTPWS